LETFTSLVVIGSTTVSVRGILDGGSNASYIHTNVLRSVGVRPTGQMTLAVQSYGSEGHTSTNSGSIEVEFLGINGQRKGCTLFTSGCIVGNPRLAPSPKVAAEILPAGYQYADPDLFSGSPRPIEILIGNDLRNIFVRLNCDKQIAEGLVLKPTMFGWIPSGRALSLPNPVVHTTLVSKIEKREKTFDPEFQNAQEIKFLWDLEVLGICDSELNSTDDVVIKHFRRTTRFEDGRYVVCWPRKTERPELPSHYRMCVARLKSLLRTTHRDVLAQCDEIIREQLAAGVIETPPQESTNTVHYVPHKPVIREGKVRIVIDASAKLKNGRSLNDFLHAGPSLIGSLVEILINFRLKEIAISGDIEKAFLRVGLNEEDRDLVRFLWVEDFTQPIEKIRLVIYRFTRTPFGVVSSPFLLNMVLQELFADAGEALFQTVSKCFYVDNFIMSVSSDVQAVELYEAVTERLASAGFNLRDWISNSETVNDALSPEKRKCVEGKVSILGMEWDHKRDTMSIKFSDQPDSCQVTLRLALSVLAAVFDPLGLCLPSLLELKMFVQECWKAKVTMDEGLPALMVARFRKLILEREEIKDIQIPRYLWSSASSEGSYELHCFCDASKVAYGCAIYLVHKTRVGIQSEVRLIFAKLRVAPIQQRSIPQLELLGVLLGKRAVLFVRKLLSITVARTLLWTDATTVIQWLHSLAVQPPFVHNRLTELRQAQDIIFRYVSTKDNPADVLTRGQKASRLRDNNLWWHGPTWLVHKRLWPAPPSTASEFDTAVPRSVTLFLQNLAQNSFLTEANENQLNWTEFIKKLLRVPFISKWYTKQGLTQSESFLRAELILVRLLQSKYFPSELRLLLEGLKPASDLDLFLHTDGVIHCRDRYESAPINWEQSHPILLPRESPIVRTLLQKVHRTVLHAGAETTLLKFRERYWITKARTLVKSVIHRCNICRRWKGGAYKLPPMPLLPQVRTAPVIPFMNVGLDCFGPLQVRKHGSSPLSTSKTYGTIFTCLVTRAVHLELAGDLSGDQFLQALIRFSSRRGKPKFIVSDNGSNFKFIQPLVGRKVELTDAKVNDFIKEQGIDWYFNRAYQPWQGGVFERMIGLVKDLLLKVLGRDVVDYITLTTVLCRIEDIINSRPLTYIPGNEITEPLTPNCFLRPAGNSTSAELNVNPAAVSLRASTLLPGYKAVYALIEHFRNCFYTGYLQCMREKHVALHRSPRGAVKFAPGVGEMVLVKGLDTRRTQWPLGVVERLDARGAQAWVRVVDWVATGKLTPEQRAQPNQLHKTKLVQKAVNSLYPLEVRPQVQDSASSAPAAQMPRLDS
jgi:transposase InsO family protein